MGVAFITRVEIIISTPPKGHVVHFKNTESIHENRLKLRLQHALVEPKVPGRSSQLTDPSGQRCQVIALSWL